jgi:hypothetical protein
MRVAAPRPNMRLLLFQYAQQTCRHCRVEACRHADATPTRQLDELTLPPQNVSLSKLL